MRTLSLQIKLFPKTNWFWSCKQELLSRYFCLLLPSANEVMFLHVSVCPQGVGGLGPDPGGRLRGPPGGVFLGSLIHYGFYFFVRFVNLAMLAAIAQLVEHLACLISCCERWHDKLPVSNPTNALQVCGRDGSATMLATKRLAGESQGMCNTYASAMCE